MVEAGKMSGVILSQNMYLSNPAFNASSAHSKAVKIGRRRGNTEPYLSA
jgi:hypothetical protein